MRISEIKNMAITYTPFARSGTNILPPNQYMTIGQQLVSPNGRFRLVLQADSTLALFDGQSIVWTADASQPYSTTIPNQRWKATSFYVSNSLFLQDSLRARTWTASTGRTESGLWYRSHLSIQDDGNLVNLDVNALFTSVQTTLLPNSQDVIIIPAGTSLVVNQRYSIGAYSLVFESGGNLVIYRNDGAVIWNTATYGKGTARATMQEDGNFVLSAADGTVIWTTQTGGHPGAYAQIQSNGAFVVCQGTPLWARYGWAPGKPPKVFYPNSGKWPTYDRVIYMF
jgi:hypothetical protein